MITVDGKNYSDKNGRNRNFECVNKKCCPVRATRTEDGQFLVSGEHSTECNKKYARRQLLAATKEKIQSNGILCVLHRNYDIFNSIVINNPEYDGLADYHNVERTLRRAKSEIKVHIPMTSDHTTKMQNLHQQLENTDAIIYPDRENQRTFRVIPITTQSNGKTFHHLVMYDPDFVKLFTTEPWVMDGTFDGRPNIKDCEQLFTVNVVKEVEIEKKKTDGTVEKVVVRKPLGLFYALTENRNTETYQAIFAHMRQEFPNLEPVSAMADYEGASRKGVKIVFPMIVLLGCWFHHNQASFSNAKNHGVAEKNNKKNNPRAHKQLKKFQALPLLPLDMMSEGLRLVIAETREMYATSHWNERNERVVELNPKWERYISYHESQWFNRVKPEDVCVYRCPERTSNFSEQGHRHYINFLGKRKQIEPMMQGLIAMVALTWVKYDNIIRKMVTPPRKSAKQKEKDALIARCWDRLDRREYDVATFLQEVSYFEEERGRSEVPEAAEKVCVTRAAYKEKRFLFPDGKEKFSAEDLFMMPFIMDQ